MGSTASATSASSATAIVRKRLRAAGNCSGWYRPNQQPIRRLTTATVSRRYRRPADRRSRPQQWADAVQTLADLLDRCQEWRDNLPSGLANSATAEALDAVLELRGYVEELQAVELPKGFGRD